MRCDHERRSARHSRPAADLSARRRRRASGARRRRFPVVAGTDRRAARPHRFRQVDLAALDRRFDAAVGRQHHLSRPAGGRAGARHCHGVPVLRAVPLAHGVGKRPARPRGARASRGGNPPARAGGDRSHRPRRLRIRLSARIVGRHAPARRLCPRAGRASQHPVDGRAVLGARRADGGDVAHRLPRALGRRQAADQGCPSGDPQHRGSGADVRPHPVVFDQSGPHHSRDRRRAEAAAQPARPAFPRAGRKNLCGDDRADADAAAHRNCAGHRRGNDRHHTAAGFGQPVVRPARSARRRAL